MSTNLTETYKLHLWEPDDDFLREEFNENTSRTESALLAVESRANQSISTLRTHVDTQTEALSKRINDNLSHGDQSSAGLSGRIDALSSQVSVLNNTLKKYSDDADAALRKHVDQADTALGSRISSTDSTLRGLISNGDSTLKSQFESALAALDRKKPNLAYGSYTGNGANEQMISLGFTPKLVYSCTDWGYAGTNSYISYGGIAAQGMPVAYNTIRIVEGGFIAKGGGSASDRGNNADNTYHYFALY